MSRNRIVFQNYTFTDDSIMSGSVYTELSAIGETLAADVLTFTTQNTALAQLRLCDVNGVELNDVNGVELYVQEQTPGMDLASVIKYGEAVDYYHDDVLIGRFYAKPPRRIGPTTYKFECVSAIGLLISMKHMGGIYEGETVGSIVADILGSIPYTIDADVAAVTMYGWLPIASKRDNLQQVLFACGGSVLKDSAGEIHIGYNDPSTAITVPDDRVYLGGSVDYLTPATDVTVIEHSFYASSITPSEVIFDNTLGVAAASITVEFDKPYHSLVGNGITIEDSGANYAVISGTGTLEGVPYIHIQRALSQSTGAVGDTKEASSTKATLVSSLNSSNVLARMAAYYGQATQTACGIVVNDERTGDLIKFTDPFYENTTGYIKSMEMQMSATLKANAVISTNWKPTALGNNYDSYITITDDDLVNGTWTPDPALVGKQCQLVIFSGAQGGQGGYAGESPQNTNGIVGGMGVGFTYRGQPVGIGYVYYDWGYPGDPATGGQGGKGGAGGASAAKILTVDIPSLAASYSVAFGAGGAGGSGGTAVRNPGGNISYTDPTDGALGGHTVFGSWDTDNGGDFSGTYVSKIDGTILADVGDTGISGGKGGDGGAAVHYLRFDTAAEASSYDYAALGKGGDGDAVDAYTGGIGEDGTTGNVYDLTSGNVYLQRGYYRAMNGGGGGGGGAAMGNNGSNGQQSSRGTYNLIISATEQHSIEYLNYLYYSGSVWTPIGASGGDGADATIAPAQAVYKGGKGGAGGGGGGGAGASAANAVAGSYNYGGAWSGKGGNGGQGGQGSNGFAVLYFKA